MAKAHIVKDLTVVIAGLSAIEPFSTHPNYRVHKAAIENLLGVASILDTIERYKPGLLRALEDAAIEELMVRHDDLDEEVDALIGRYCRKREPLP